MKFSTIILVTSLIASGNTLAAEKHIHNDDHKPMHGGIVVESKDIDFELVAKPDLLQLYLRDHGKPMDISKVAAKITLLAGTEKQDVELKPAGNRLEAKGQFKVSAGTKAVAQVSIAGKSSSARFVLK
ncbi:MAG: hypothetical protein KF804_08260 [Burkholderiales bacterium]|nr:hypothetical protein [Burkholderiales bacterium]